MRPQADGVVPRDFAPLKDGEALKDLKAHNASKDGSDIQANDKGPSNSTEQMNKKIKQMMNALKAWAEVLQQELDSGSEVGDGALRLKVEEISFIATVAVRSGKDGKGKCLLKLTCGKDDPHVRKPSVEKLPESHKKSKKLPESHKKSKEAMSLPPVLPSENWSMVDVLDDIKNVMAESEAAASGRQAK